ncbi:DUF3307 domain-containing protein [Streptococcus didelphis]|uniref:DUF3307 domain-containing protein n=1 Tax=Streptococcus didelphis TaxID=102886 RepID=UPI000372302A|nr:DUF3307 domain-containing protein [Streptococcus didelphis]
MLIGLSSFLRGNPILCLLLICHFLSDFHLQSQKIADLKNSNLSYLLKHLLLVALPLAVLCLLNFRNSDIYIIILGSHALIDYLKPRITKLLKVKVSFIFLLDQFLHILIILIASQFLRHSNQLNWLNPAYLNGLLFLLLITKPTNIAFKIFFEKYQPQNQEKIDTIGGAGAMIGILERIVIGICMIMGQFASIGLVFTAKSIARYNKISESPTFAEYYLIGSLFSILSVFIASWICFY